MRLANDVAVAHALLEEGVVTLVTKKWWAKAKAVTKELAGSAR